MNEIVKNSQCLMLKTKDQRTFFTYEKNYIPLLEFSRLFKAEISIVSVQEAEVLDLSELAPAICDVSYTQTPPIGLSVIEIKSCVQNRQKILKSAKKIADFIENLFKSGDVVCLKELKLKFDNVSVACL